jgi:hypothetical protein
MPTTEKRTVAFMGDNDLKKNPGKYESESLFRIMSHGEICPCAPVRRREHVVRLCQVWLTCCRRSDAQEAENTKMFRH